MTRKDTILIAVLINAGLLIVMFATAIKPNRLEVSGNRDFVNQNVAMEASHKSKTSEIDEMLNSYTRQEDSKKKGDEPRVQAVKESQPLPSPSVKTEAATIQEKPSGNSLLVVDPKPSNKYTSITVKAGDALEKIAKIHNVSVKELMEINHLEGTKLQIGQTLYIPSIANQMVLQNKTQEYAHEKFYVVKNGDNPWTIASKNHIKIEELLRLNNLNEEKARRLKPGDRLRIQ